jgi:hypothetical protein
MFIRYSIEALGVNPERYAYGTEHMP